MKQKIEMMEKIEKLSINMMLVENYVNGNIEKVIAEVNKQKEKDPDFTNADDSEFVTFLQKIIVPMKTYTELVTMKKLMKNKKDFIKLGEELHKVAQDMIDYGVKHENDKSEEGKKTEEPKKEKTTFEKVDKILDKIADSIFEDLD